jgi:hypothetical protein
LYESGVRFSQVVREPFFSFHTPTDPDSFEIIERLEGNATTDFGAPAVVSKADNNVLDEAEMNRLIRLLHAYWDTFDKAVDQAAGRELRKGPRGGGRDLEKIMGHVLEADRAYLRRLAWKPGKIDSIPLEAAFQQIRQEILHALDIALNQGLPETGPRGGVIWPPRYFIRKVAWHVLDHAWEIEDRII